ncbi:TniQ family protein [Paenibacillus alba]|uniref:TnsD family Tn7-like transposition protein n=1 Tax=Paenibacillus alba TaxID=1197127 RepID=UPI001567A702|nr:TnsD family Tn7-like transposition protein [Paenibacillus alba]NQX71812.1 TniQ family protein [Paenibacillus alba]
MNKHMSYFPELYPDEILYSGLARYHQRAGGASQKSTMVDLFGTTEVCAVTDLPGHLQGLSTIIGGIYSPERLLLEHTLYPYYTAFLPKDMATAVGQSMFVTSGPFGTAHSLVGLPASAIKSPLQLRFCNSCIMDDTRQYGEPYWHRIHQVPGIYICSKHQEFLQNSSVPYTSKYHKHQLIPLSAAIKAILPTSNFTIHADFDQLMFISTQSSILLDSSNRNVDFGGINSNNYAERLQAKQLVNLSGYYRFKSIINQFKMLYGEELLELLYCSVSVKNQDSWIHKLLRNPHSVTHPLRHILIMRFLDISLQKNEPVTTVYHPFGMGPWPCLNKAADHYKQNVVEECKISRCSKSLKPIGTFACTCGFVFARKGPDITSEDRYRIGRIKQFGDVWRAKLRELTKTQSLSFRQMGRELNVNSITVQRQLHLVPNLEILGDESKVKDKKLRIRESLNSCINQIENPTGVFDGQMAPKPQKVRSLPIKRVNWVERDHFLYPKLQHAQKVILEEDPPIRVTVTEFGKRCGHYVWLEKKIKLLPKCEEFVREHQESTQQFQIRRLEWASNRLLKQFGTISGWRLLKLAGISNIISSDVQKKIVDIVQPYDAMFINAVKKEVI